MKEIFLVAGQELLFNLRRPGFIIMTLLIPALGLLALLAASLFGGQVGDFFQSQFTANHEAVGYVDHSDLLTAHLPQYSERFIAYPDEASARADLLAEKIDSYFVVPSDYLRTAKVTVYAVGGGFSTFAAADDGDMRSFLLDHLLENKVDAAIQERVRTPMRVEAVNLNSQGEVSTEGPFSWVGDFVIPYLFSILFVVTIFTTSGFLLQSVSEEKEGRIMEILLSSINSTQLLAGKILGLGALGLIQVFVWVGAGAALLTAATSIFALTGAIDVGLGTVILSLVYFVLGYLLFATLMAVAGSMGTTMRESQQIASIFSIAAALPWMTMGIVLANPHSPIAIALSYFPLTSPVMMLIRLGFGQVPAVQTVISLGLLLAGLAFSLWAGTKVFRVGLLMYGKRPSLHDLSRAFKQA